MERSFASLLLAVSMTLPAAAETILVVGDSHTVGKFGQKLDDALRESPGNRVATYGVCSSNPQSYLSETPHSCGYLFRDFAKKAPAKWLGARVYREIRPDGKGGKGGTREVETIKTPELVQLLSDHVPTLTVIALGSNVPVSAESVARTLKAIHDSGSACVWVGPPEMRKPTSAAIDAVYATLRRSKVTESATQDESRKDSCRLIDSRAFSYLRYPATAGDGTHYKGALTPLAEKWGADGAAAVLAAFKP